MKYVNFLLLLLPLSFALQANEALDAYYQKYEECANHENSKKPLTADVMNKYTLKKQDLKYILIIKDIRVAKCSEAEEKAYLNTVNKEKKITTQSEYNQSILAKLNKEELVHINKINQRLAEFNVDVNVISLYDKLK